MSIVDSATSNPLLGIIAPVLLYSVGATCLGIARVAARTNRMLADTGRGPMVGWVLGGATAGLALSVVATLVTDEVDSVDTFIGLCSLDVDE
jgi:hypothetical protein